MVHFNGEKRKTVQIVASSPSGDSTPEPGRVDRGKSTSFRRRLADRTVFRLRPRALLRRRARPSSAETPQRTRVGPGAVTLGSFEDLERELRRSRRFGRPFVLARVHRSRLGSEAEAWREQTLAILSSLVRTVDRVWSHGGDVYVLLPESDRAAGTAALARIRGPVSRVLSDEEVDGIRFAVFAPDECPTRQALLAALHQRVKDVKTQTSGRPESHVAPVDEPEEASG